MTPLAIGFASVKANPLFIKKGIARSTFPLIKLWINLAGLYPWGEFSIFYRDLLHIIGFKWKNLFL